MLEGLLVYLQERSALELARDVIDVSIIYYIFYRVLLVLRGTRALQVGVGLGFVFLLYVVAQWLQLLTVQSLLGSLIPNAAILIIVVVFQNDIRRALMRMGSQPWFGSTRTKESQAMDEVVEAATELARHRTGALIAFEQDANLDEFIGVNKGVSIDAAVTSELLVSIFIPESVNKLHDGAVIIRNLRIAKAGVFFPMPDQRVLDPSFGSRHRAALGITEETDAVVVVVSEERGSISFCFNGNIVGNLDGPGLRRALEGIFSPKLAKKRAKAKREATKTPVKAAVETPVPESVQRPRPVEELPPTPTPLEVAPAVRARPAEPEPERRETEPPAPLRKAKEQKSTETEAPTAPPPTAIPLAPTPMRAGATTRTDSGTRAMPRSGNPEGGRASREESLPDSDERGEPS